ncbi:hypothetical protein LT318_00338 [Spiroplasma sp. JKS002670]|nr:hypothetical protein [Spiroplasma sp. JKS002670]
MFIIKLGKICSYTEGYVNPEISNEKYFSSIGMPWLKVADLIHGSNIYSTKHYLSKLGQSLAKNNTQLFKKETIVWSKSGSIGITSILKIDVMANRGILNIKPNDKYIKNKYLFYFLCKNKNIYSSKGTGAVLKHFYGPNLMNEEINLPSIKTQDSVIGIIERNEKLFLKYSNCVRIDNLNNVQTDMKNLIGIIEPIDLIKNNLLIIKKKIISFINKLQIKKTNERNIFNSITTGKLNANAAINDGRFNFYTCGGKILKTNNSSFCGRNIILSGNGELFTWIYDGIFDAYQRVYVLKERRDFYTTFYSLNKELNNLRKRSNGAVIKFIKKEDIFSIEKYSNSHEYILKQLYTFLLKIDVVEEKINKLQKKMILLRD